MEVTMVDERKRARKTRPQELPDTPGWISRLAAQIEVNLRNVITGGQPNFAAARFLLRRAERRWRARQTRRFSAGVSGNAHVGACRTGAHWGYRRTDLSHEEKLELPLVSLLPLRLCNALEKHLGVLKVRSLVHVKRSELQNLPGVGAKTIQSIGIALWDLRVHWHGSQGWYPPERRRIAEPAVGATDPKVSGRGRKRREDKETP